MEFLRVAKRRSLLSETIYILLNLALAGAVFGAVLATGTPWLALGLVFLSKWRVLAVRPRYWFAHIETNMVDFIVSISLVLLMYTVGQLNLAGSVWVQALIAALYAVWLLAIKPRSKRVYVVAQSAIAAGVGTIALATVSYELPSSVFVLAMWVIGYSCARHVLSAYSEENIRMFSLLWAFVFAEIGWLYYHWMIAYTLPFLAGIKLPQLTIVVLGLCFVVERVYASYVKHQKIKLADVMLPMLLSFGIILVLLLFFNGAAIGAN